MFRTDQAFRFVVIAILLIAGTLTLLLARGESQPRMPRLDPSLSDHPPRPMSASTGSTEPALSEPAEAPREQLGEAIDDTPSAAPETETEDPAENPWSAEIDLLIEAIADGGVFVKGHDIQYTPAEAASILDSLRSSLNHYAIRSTKLDQRLKNLREHGPHYGFSKAKIDYQTLSMTETDFHYCIIYYSAHAVSEAVREGTMRVEAQRRDAGGLPSEGSSDVGYSTVQAFHEREGLVAVAFLHGPWLVRIAVPRELIAPEIWEEAVRIRRRLIEAQPR